MGDLSFMLRPTTGRRGRRRLLGVGAVTALLLGAPAFAGATMTQTPCGTSGAFAQSGSTYMCTYSTAGTDTFTVPSGITSLVVVAVGAAGGSGFYGQSGGSGASVEDTAVPATPGDVLGVTVGGAGGAGGSESSGTSGSPGGGGASGTIDNTDSNDGGGGGGGYSGLFDTAGDPLVIGGGGGGGGGASADYEGGNGGPGGTTGSGGAGGNGDAGGGGGGTTPSDPMGACPSGDDGSAGQGADGGYAGTAGSYLQGGTGGESGYASAGGGGGGGYCGGGGGGAGSYAAGGGGGSSYGAGPGLTNEAAANGSAYVTITYTPATPTLSLGAPGSGTTGTAIPASSVSATLSGGASPTGTVTFTVFGPSASAPTDCSSGGTTVGTATVSGNGTYEPSASYTPTQVGDYYWYASYGGDSGNMGASSGCGNAMSETVVKATPALSVSAPDSGTAGTAIAAASVSATLSGGASPTGTVTFTVFGPSASAPTDCSSGGTTVGTATVSGNGTYEPSASYTPTQVGDYYWYASYGGDSSNTAASSGCGAMMAETSVGQASPSLSLSAPSSGKTGTAIRASSITATLSGGASPTGTVTFTVFGPSASAPTDCSSGGTTVGTAAVSGNGTYAPSASYTPTQVGDYYWYASYGGDSSNMGASSACGNAMSETVVSRPTATPSRLKLGRVTTSGDTGKASLSCSGHSSCAVTIHLEAVETIKHGKVTAARSTTHTKTVTVGAARITLAAGQTKDVKVTLNATGKRLLRKLHKLRVKLSVSGTSAGKKMTASKTATFKAPRKKAKEARAV